MYQEWLKKYEELTQKTKEEEYCPLCGRKKEN